MGKRDVQKLFEKQISTGKAKWYVKTRSTAQEMPDDYAESLQREQDRERRERFGTDLLSTKRIDNSLPRHLKIDIFEQINDIVKNGGLKADEIYLLKADKNKPDKGLKNGSCNVTACQKPGATFFNKSTKKYYCCDCAREINWPGGRQETFELYGTYLLCEHED